MTDLVFNIDNLFRTETTDDCLVQYGAEMYLIPSYQRGYKWSSEDNGAVTKLLSDLNNAFTSHKKSEYYLQYITVKQNKKKKALEVIDGQQRLTTLSILLSILSMKMDRDNLAENKLEYAVRSNFFRRHIYSPVALSLLMQQQWNPEAGLQLDDGEDNNKQDVYYIFNAAVRINIFLESLDNVADFHDYLTTKVKVIVNVVEQHISGEKVFSNINNKVSLTESELIKGLIITRLGRNNTNSHRKSFREIQLLRHQIGHKWDQIANWCSRSDIKSFYFDNENGTPILLRLVALSLSTEGHRLDTNANEKDNPVFEFFNRLGNLEVAFEKFQHYYSKLNDWHLNTEYYNLLGYIRFAPRSKNKTLNFIRECLLLKSNEKVKQLLHNKVYEHIPNNLNGLYYGSPETNDSIHSLLLALSVFTEDSTVRFNFYAYQDEKWSLEHIFPQSPEGKNKNFTDGEKQEVRKMLLPIIDDELEKLLALNERDENEKKRIHEALNRLGILHGIGNMCLLTSKNNSKLGCGLFKAKRQLILQLTKEAAFVPRHTFEVFSKMSLIDDPGDLQMWTKENIESHTTWIEEKINNLRTKFTYESR